MHLIEQALEWNPAVLRREEIAVRGDILVIEARSRSRMVADFNGVPDGYFWCLGNRCGYSSGTKPFADYKKELLAELGVQ